MLRLIPDFQWAVRKQSCPWLLQREFGCPGQECLNGLAGRPGDRQGVQRRRAHLGSHLAACIRTAA